MGDSSKTFPPLRAELWIARRLGHRDLFVGTTTPEERRERVRRVMLDEGFADYVAGSKNGEIELFRDTYRRFYGEPLE